MTIKNIKKLLEEALIKDGKMQYRLYEYELKEFLRYLKSSLTRDRDEFIFAVTENSGHVSPGMHLPVVSDPQPRDKHPS